MRTRIDRWALLVAAVCAWGVAACDESLQGIESAPGAGGAPRIVAVTSQSLLAQFGVQLDTPIRVRVLDESGRPVGSAAVHYAVLVGAGAFSADSTLTDDQGFTQVLFRPLTAGTVIVEARVERPGGTDRIQFTIQVLSDPDVAGSVLRIGGSGQSARVGSVLPEPLVVRVLNDDGFPVDSFPVVFTVGAAQGTGAGIAGSPDGPFAHQVAVRTDEAGYARAWMKLGTLPGPHAATATVALGEGPGGSSASVAFTATATASTRAARLIAIAGQTQSVVVDTIHLEGAPDFKGTEPNPFVVQAVDEFGNPVEDAPITWFVSDGGGSLVSSLTLTDENGLSTNRLFDATVGNNAIVALTPGADPVTFVVTGELYEPPAEPDQGGGDGGGGGA